MSQLSICPPPADWDMKKCAYLLHLVDWPSGKDLLLDKVEVEWRAEKAADIIRLICTVTQEQLQEARMNTLTTCNAMFARQQSMGIKSLRHPKAVQKGKTAQAQVYLCTSPVGSNTSHPCASCISVAENKNNSNFHQTLLIVASFIVFLNHNLVESIPHPAGIQQIQ